MKKTFLLNPHLMTFCIFTACFSGLGQTYILSLFNPFFTNAHQLTATQIGGVYSLATLLSGLGLPWVGNLSDRLNLRSFFLLGLFFMSVGYLMFLFSSYIVILFFAYFFVRLSGQGFMTLAAKTSAAKYFQGRKGKALSWTSVGHLIAESLFPITLVFMSNHYDFNSMIAILLVTLISLSFLASKWLIKLPHRNEETQKSGHNLEPKTIVSTIYPLFKDARLWLIIIPAVVVPFSLTGIIYHNNLIIDQLGWTLESWASSFFIFAFSRFGASLLIGQLIDRIGAVKLYPLHVLTFIMALITIFILPPPFNPLVFLSLCGVSVGIAGPLILSLYADTYGPKELGKFHGLNSMMMILTTSSSPVLFGFLLENILSIQALTSLLIILSLIAMVFGSFLRRVT